MNLAKISTEGQITVPHEVRQDLGVNPGDKILFIKKAKGVYAVLNAAAYDSVLALQQAQKDFAGSAEAIGITSDDDVMELIHEIRYGDNGK